MHMAKVGEVVIRGECNKKGPCSRQEGLSGLSQRADSMYDNHAHQTCIALNTKHLKHN